MNYEASVLWTHPQPESTLIAQFADAVAARFGIKTDSYERLHAWSIDAPDDFWKLWLEWSGIAVEGSTDLVHDGGPPYNRRWFPDVSLSFAAELLRRATDPVSADKVALVAVGEAQDRRAYSWIDLARRVFAVREQLSPHVRPGDAVVGILPNADAAVVAMLATASLGAVWSSASPDFGTQAIVDRFAQVKPTVCIVCNGYVYGGKRYDVREKVAAIQDRLPSVSAWIGVEVIDDAPLADKIQALQETGEAHRQLGPNAVAEAIGNWPRFGFDQPLYTMFSSGTTGIPKCIVHGAGGTLIQHSKEHMLHADIRPGDCLLYYTTTGWMMWNWMVSALFAGASIVTYDGSPMAPDAEQLWKTAHAEGVSHLGVSPKFLGACRDQALDISAYAHGLRVIFSTGSPLLPEDFDYVYQDVAPQAQLASISGGTDIISCFMLGVPTLPVRRGEIQAAGLGMDVIAATAKGAPIIGARGELVCRGAFPSRPLRFVGDSADKARYREAYFNAFPGWWTHGDYIEISGSVGTIGGIVVHGRSDATLNPGGVRIGTAEIYRIVEGIEAVADSLAVGRPVGGDVEIVLFIRMAHGCICDDALRHEIRQRLRLNASPRHVPRAIHPVADIPYTRSGKKVEIAVRDILTGQQPKNTGALANPMCLDAFAAIARDHYGADATDSVRGGSESALHT